MRLFQSIFPLNILHNQMSNFASHATRYTHDDHKSLVNYVINLVSQWQRYVFNFGESM